MRDFVYHVPTEVIFGRASLEQIAPMAEKYGGSNVLLVYGGGSVVRSGLLGRIETALDAAGIRHESFGGVKPNPTLEKAREGVAKAVGMKADMVIGVGGGSAIDTAKAIAHGAAAPDIDIWKYWLEEEKVKESLPIGVVLTLPATGSETSDSAVLTYAAVGQKRGLNCQANRAKFAVMDPSLCATLPRYQVACGVTDILMHTLDRYFCANEDNETTDELAEAVLRVTMKNGPIAYADAGDYHAMSELMWCGSLSHCDLTGCGGNRDFAPHKLGHELSGKFDVAHGASLSTVWCHFANHVLPYKPGRFARFAVNVLGLKGGGDDLALGKSAIAKMHDFFRSLDMPTNFSELGIGVQAEEVIEDLARRCSRDKSITVGSLHPLGYDEMKAIYAACNF